MSTINLRHVTKRYGLNEQPGVLGRRPTDTDNSSHPDRVNALDDLSLTIRDGETLGIIGPSGCGKTTLLRVIAGLLKPDSGTVFSNSIPVQDIPMSERGIGMVFQNYALYPHMPAYDNIGFYDLIRKQPEKTPKRINHIVQVMGVDIKHLLSRKPLTLSGGEQQRIAVARCLAREPKLFLFDEPLSNLDAKLRLETRVQLNRLLRHYKITAVYVTHDQTEAIALSHRIAIMRAGKIEQVGTFRALYDTPRNAFVAQFFGTPPMNLFLGHVWQDSWEGKNFSITPIRPGLKQGQAVWIGVRPEHITLTTTGIPAKIERLELNLSQRQKALYTHINRQSCIVNADLSLSVKSGDTIHLQFPIEHLCFFDQKTGARIG